MHVCTVLFVLLFGTFARASKDMGLRNGLAAPSADFVAFTQSCTAWRLEYLVGDGELSLWTSCRANQTTGLPAGTELHVVSRLALDISYVANEYAIEAASPSNSAPVSFSSLCHDCHLDSSAAAASSSSSSVMTCNCTTNGADGPPMSVDLARAIAGMPDGVPCFADGVVCAVQQSAVTSTVSATTSPSVATPVKPECTGAE